MTFEPTLQNDFLALVEHYRSQRRDLPWRQTREPYAVLISEVMLQQTRVETVIPYYRKFVEAFPTLEALAGASLEQVLAAWSGLGYYRRARMLHRTARQLAERGDFPRHPGELRRLPGIGDYTAAAIASIAFGQPAVALDGNALRVFTRYFGIGGDPGSVSTRNQIRALVLPHISEATASDFTQAVMELGARQCSVRRPDCRGCPLRSGCRAFQEGDPERYPRREPRRRRERVERAAARVEDHGQCYLIQARGRLLEGMWLPPMVNLEPGQDAREALAAGLERYGPVELLRELGQVRHSITYRCIRCRVFQGRPTGRLSPEGRWFAAGELPSLPAPAFVRRILALAPL